MDMSAQPRLSPLARAESRERGSSPWLGRGTPPSATFLRYQDLQRRLSTMGGVTTLAPATPIGAFMDWWLHLASSPAKQWELAEFALEQFARLGSAFTRPPNAPWVVDPLPQDKRFDDPQWRQPPFSWIAQAFLLRQAWWQRATTGVPGVTAMLPPTR